MNLIEIFSNLPPDLATVLIAMTPTAELTASIPIALEVFHLPTGQAIILSIIGTLIPATLIIFLLGPISRWLSRHNRHLARFFDWLFERTRKKFYEKHQKWGDLALLVWIATPTPLTGTWTGSIAAWLFGIKPKRAIPIILVGQVIAAVLVTSITLGIVSFF